MNILYMLVFINISIYLVVFNLLISPNQIIQIANGIIAKQQDKIRSLEEYKREITTTFNLLSIEFDIIKKHLDLEL